MANGFLGNILRVNLTNETIEVEHPPEAWYRTYLGGTAVIAYYLLNEVPADCDPLGPENKLIFATGPLTGTPIAGGGRNGVGAKSPLTGGFGDSQGGGFWMAELKRAGFDHIIIEGQADRPVYLWVRDGKAELRDAEALWGRDTAVVQKMIQEELDDPAIRVTQCGIAGENQVRFACVVNDLTHFAGRTGMGAVMGAKRLKAIAVRGTQQVPVADRDEVLKLARRLSEDVRAGTRNAALHDTGTAGGVMGLKATGGLPTRNFQEGDFEQAEAISGPTMRDTILIDRETCFACPIFCKRVVKSEAYDVDPVYGGPEYETIGSLGSNCGIDDLPAIAKGNEMCNRWGMDTISAGMTISWAMECVERGILSPSDFDGIPLKFGEPEGMLKLLEKMAHRDGVGDLLAEGSARAARHFGPQAESVTLTIKGQEIPMHEPRLKYGLGLGYAVSPTGADHCHNMHDTAFENDVASVSAFGVIKPLPADDLSAEKVRLFYYQSCWQHWLNSAVMCQFVGWTKHELLDAMRAVTGWDTSLFEMLKTGERAATLGRLFNLRVGFDDRDDELNERFFRAFKKGPLAAKWMDHKVFNRARVTYYHMMGWDDLGRPTPSRLSELDLGWAREAPLG